jgi:hypothetical protein
MLPDDVFRERLEQTLVQIEERVSRMRASAAVDVAATPRYWRLAVQPFFRAACPFELIVKSDQKFSLKLGGEAFEDRQIDRFELFPHLVRAIEEGQVEKISKYNALTEALVGIEIRVRLEPGWDWLGERRIAPATSAEEWRTHRYLAYRRQNAPVGA